MESRAHFPHNVLKSRARLGEGPLWHGEQQMLYWVDIYNHRVHQFSPTMGTDRIFEVEDEVTAITIAGPHRLLIALRKALAFLDTESGAVTPLQSIELDKPKNRLNDGKCDPQGRFWIGSMNEEEQPEANLYRYDPDGSIYLMEAGLTVSNGLGWSPDGNTFYLTDTPTHKIYAYDFNQDTGEINNRRVLIDLQDEGLLPDGLTIDAGGYLWSAMWNGWYVVRFAPDGQEVMRVKMPVQCPTSCTFGGEELDVLYITTASVGLSQAEIQRSFYSGDLFCLKTDIQGLPSSSFAMQNYDLGVSSRSRVNSFV